MAQKVYEMYKVGKITKVLFNKVYLKGEISVFIVCSLSPFSSLHFLKIIFNGKIKKKHDSHYFLHKETSDSPLSGSKFVLTPLTFVPKNPQFILWK